ncbi:sialidase family protein [Bacillus cereus]|uniref:sialidase family protein n=1 Tax=Bacillus cereus TaxID=1396 RepID=UPI000BF44B41|nr:hypothetical protein [Bacillus cereus]PFU21521.1 hypothetical protein COK76_26195 [Bacillus cereus]
MSLCNDPRPQNTSVSNNEPSIQNEPSVAVNPLSDHIYVPLPGSPPEAIFSGNKAFIVAANDFNQVGLDVGNCRIHVYYNDGLNFTDFGLEPPEYFDFIADPSVDSAFRPTDLKYFNLDSEEVGLFLIAGVAGKNQPNPHSGTIVVYLPYYLESNQTWAVPNFHREPVIVSRGYGKEIHNDKPNLAIDKSGGSPYLGRSYITYTRYYNNHGVVGTSPSGSQVALKPIGHSEIFIQRSEDYGLTWSAPIRLSEPFNRLSPLTLSLDQPLGTSEKTMLFTNNTITSDGSSGGILVTLEAKDDTSSDFKITIMINAANKIQDDYTVGKPYNNHGLSFEIYRAFGFKTGDTVTIPLDGEASITIRTPYPKNDVWGSNIAVGPEGQVYVGWIEDDEFSADSNFQTASFKVRRSDDGGITFHPIVSVNTFNKVPDPFDPPVPPPPATLPPGSLGYGLNLNVLTQANLAVDTSTGDFKGRVYAVWHQAYRHSDLGLLPAVIMMSYSDDNGDTWIGPRVISPMGRSTYNIFPSISVSRNTGRVGIVFYSNQCGNGPGFLDVMKVEWDGDISNTYDFSHLTHILTDSNFNPTNNKFKRNNNQNWIGDYIGTAMVPPDKLLAVWTKTDQTLGGGFNDELFSSLE